MADDKREIGKWIRYNDKYIISLYTEIENEKRMYRNAAEFVSKEYTLEQLEKDIKDKEEALSKITSVRNSMLSSVA